MKYPSKQGSLLASLVLAVSLNAAPAGAAPPRSNVLVIVPDDISFDQISFYHPEGPRTPHIDALARESLRLTDFHVSPTCAPSRAALLTGRYNNATGVWHTIMGRQILRADEVTMAEVCRENGYKTGLFGKWHLGDGVPFRPVDRGFDHSAVFRGGGVGQQPDVWGNTNLPPFTLLVNERPETVSAGDGLAAGFSTDVFTDRAIAWMRERVAGQEPFFLLAAYNVAHDPQDRPPDARPGVDARTATIENLDRNIGRLLDALAQSGRAEDTIVVFFPDNGMASQRLRGGKASHWEGGHRVPCFLRWPKIGWGGSEAKGGEVDRLVAHLDLLPTLLDVLQLRDVGNRSPRVPLHGRSLRTLLDRDPANDERALIERTLVVDNQRADHLEKYKQACVMRDETDPAGRIVRKWRLSSLPGGGWALFDLLTDPLQQRDITALPENTTIVAALKSGYEPWWREVASRADEYSRVQLGTEAQPRLRLDAHDWHSAEGDASVPWHQGPVADGLRGSGYHAVEFTRGGTWRFELRRWPEEIAHETSLTSALARPIAHRSGSSGGGPTTGVALPIHTARIRIWNGETTLVDIRRPVDPGADAVVMVTPGLPPGPAMVQTWFEDAGGGALGGAAYVYVENQQP